MPDHSHVVAVLIVAALGSALYAIAGLLLTPLLGWPGIRNVGRAAALSLAALFVLGKVGA